MTSRSVASNLTVLDQPGAGGKVVVGATIVIPGTGTVVKHCFNTISGAHIGAETPHIGITGGSHLHARSCGPGASLLTPVDTDL